jgi:hypothetical protein
VAAADHDHVVTVEGRSHGRSGARCAFYGWYGSGHGRRVKSR